MYHSIQKIMQIFLEKEAHSTIIKNSFEHSESSKKYKNL